MINQPFMPVGKTYALTVGTTSASVAVPEGLYAESVLLTNNGTNVVFVEVGTGASAPTAVATASGTPGSMAILPNANVTLTYARFGFVSAISGAIGNTLFITPGIGG